MAEFYARATEVTYSAEHIPVLKIEGVSVRSEKLIDCMLIDRTFESSIYIPLDRELAASDLSTATFKVTVEKVE